MENMALDGLKWDPWRFFPTNPDLTNILGGTDVNLDIFQFFVDPNFMHFQVPRFPEAAGAAGAGRTLRSQHDPSPNAPRDQIRRKEPLLR